MLLPFWTSFLVRTFAWIVLLGRNGAVNGLLRAMGITDAPAELIYNFTGVMIGMTHALMPLAILTMVAVMENIDPNLARAATTLGARGGQAFWRIYFPLSLPGVAAAGLLVFITALGFFITPALLGGRREIMITQVIIEQVQDLLNWAFAGRDLAPAPRLGDRGLLPLRPRPRDVHAGRGAAGGAARRRREPHRPRGRLARARRGRRSRLADRPRRRRR